MAGLCERGNEPAGSLITITLSMLWNYEGIEIGRMLMPLMGKRKNSREIFAFRFTLSHVAFQFTPGMDPEFGECFRKGLTMMVQYRDCNPTTVTNTLFPPYT
ncbi:hypothetical protein ANN_15292 [Periplaneta americana]|uniref:Uncharacterized protein n=1 Tax=Periplaneta americana TaxID=6978 RepID=A0ABQ8SHU6_PERAM|nr:hypothetical protein ANN_15292 [Periplaneta americana]